MKKILLLATMAFVFFSCSKNNPENPENTILPGDVYIKYKVDGKLVLIKGDAGNINGEGVLASQLLEDNWLRIQGRKGTTNAIDIRITTDSVRTGQYTADRGFSTIVETGNVKGVYLNSHILNISISRYSSGTIDGNFAGNIYSFNIQNSGWSSFSLKEGEFKNVKIS